MALTPHPIGSRRRQPPKAPLPIGRHSKYARRRPWSLVLLRYWTRPSSRRHPHWLQGFAGSRRDLSGPEALPPGNHPRRAGDGRARAGGLRLTLGRRQANVGLEELAAPGGLFDAVGQRLADLPDAQVEQLRHGERAHHHLGGHPGRARPRRLGGAPPASPLLPRPPVGRACLRKEGLAYVPTYERASARWPRGRWGIVGCGARGVTASTQRRPFVEYANRRRK